MTSQDSAPKEPLARTSEGKGPASCWVITDGGMGMVNQALGLAEALGCAPITLKTVQMKAPWRWLPPVWGVWLKSGWVFSCLTNGSSDFSSPWPDLTISCGSRAVPVALAVRGASAGLTRSIHVQNPTINPKQFDLVIAPAHDQLDGANVFQTHGAVGRATAERLVQEAAAWRDRLANFPRPRVMVLIGGSNGRYQLGPARAYAIGAALKTFAVANNLFLLVTPSRRTGVENLEQLRRGLDDAPATVWDMTGDNPYYGWLGSADGVIVTEDSVNMVTEACATGRPVYILPLDGKGSAKFHRFHRAMQAEGYTRPFKGQWEKWTYSPLDEARRAAVFVRKKLGWPKE